LAQIKRNDEFVHLIAKTREELIALYGDKRTPEGKLKATRKVREPEAQELRVKKKLILDNLQKEYAKLKASWNGSDEYDEWFAQEVNNARLNSVAAYYDLLPGFEHLLDLNGGDLEKFYAAAERLSKKPKQERQQWLRSLGRPATP
jgi:predicted aminopeptidase